jgi:hypothetical protein
MEDVNETPRSKKRVSSVLDEETTNPPRPLQSYPPVAVPEATICYFPWQTLARAVGANATIKRQISVFVILLVF